MRHRVTLGCLSRRTREGEKAIATTAQGDASTASSSVDAQGVLQSRKQKLKSGKKRHVNVRHLVAGSKPGVDARSAWIQVQSKATLISLVPLLTSYR